MKISDIVEEKRQWRCHTNNLLKLAMETCDPKQTDILKHPFQILKNLLVELGERASELDDPILNSLMCRMTIYAVADPEDPEYNDEIVDKILKKTEELKNE